jgi:hypothetical protein
MKVIILSDGETWEVVSNQIVLCNVTDEQFNLLESGERPRDLELEGVNLEDLIESYDGGSC